MNNYLVSVIIPIYNVEKYLNRCVDSIINQTYSNLEVILVNDGSSDDSSTICDYYKSKDSRVIIIHKENGGLSDARNFGLDIAIGDYIMFLDSDDYIENNMIENLLMVVEENHSDVVICGYYADFVDANEQLLFSREQKGIKGTFMESNFCEIPLNNELIGLLGYAWNKLYRRQVITKYNLKFVKGLSLVEDIEFNAPLLSVCSKISFIESPYIHYMQRPRETLGGKFYENYYDLKKMALNSVESMLISWRRTTQEISNIKNEMNYNALKTTIRLLSKTNNYSKEEKKIYINSLLCNQDLLYSLKRYNPKNTKDKIIRYLMLKQKLGFLLAAYRGRK